ncbi:HAD-IA family hydrolase [Roseiconus nitratireducens]|uniref:HAD-IA family hydrolase n=2 Tax=Roseiconus nitratireducens TaxID=2605748 RepID=A0A5M6DAR4_9BACT|nr:HAD-IA family hydrolase [Roseiconus nitratireducens]
MNPDDFQQYDGLIFDCDGTLADSMPVHYVAWHETMSRYGIEFTEERFYSMGGMPSDKIVAMLASEQGVSVDAVGVADEKETLFRTLIPRVRRNQGVCNVAVAYFQKKPMAVASGSPRTVVQEQLAILEIAELFQTVVASEDTQRHKPEPDVFLEAARRLDVQPERCVVFEDSPLGFRAAESAGMAWVDVR